MSDKNRLKAKILILIPVVAFAFTVLCFVISMILEGSTNKGSAYSFFAFAGLLGMLLTPIPCLAMSVLGTIYAAMARARVLLVLGIVEILSHGVGVVLAIAFFIGSMGV